MRASLFAAAVGFLFLGVVAHAASVQRAPTSAADIKPRSKLPTCGTAQMPSCDALANAPLNAAKSPTLGFGAQRDGGSVFNLANFFLRNKSERSADKSALFQDQKAIGVTHASDDDAKARAKPVIDAAIDLIKNGNTKLSPEQQLLLDRLGSLTFKIAQNDINSADAGNNITRDDRPCYPMGYPNSAYNPTTHTMYICPAAMVATGKQFIKALAHEIGHVVSPCSERKAMYKVDPDMTFPGPIAECDPDFWDGEPGHEQPQNDTIASLVSEKPAYLVGYPNKLQDELVRCGIVHPVAKSSVDKPKLFATSLTCLSKRYAPTYQYAKMQYTMGQIHQGVEGAVSAKAFEKEMPAYCSRIAEEHFADSFSAKVMGTMATQQSWSKADYQIAVLDFDGFTCSEPPTKTVQPRDEYPPYRTRVATLLNDSSAQKILNCSAPTEDLCPLEITPEDVRPVIVGVGSKASVKGPASPARRSTTTGSKN